MPASGNYGDKDKLIALKNLSLCPLYEPRLREHKYFPLPLTTGDTIVRVCDTWASLYMAKIKKGLTTINSQRGD